MVMQEAHDTEEAKTWLWTQPLGTDTNITTTLNLWYVSRKMIHWLPFGLSPNTTCPHWWLRERCWLCAYGLSGKKRHVEMRYLPSPGFFHFLQMSSLENTITLKGEKVFCLKIFVLKLNMWLFCISQMLCSLITFISQSLQTHPETLKLRKQILAVPTFNSKATPKLVLGTTLKDLNSVFWVKSRDTPDFSLITWVSEIIGRKGWLAHVEEDLDVVSLSPVHGKHCNVQWSLWILEGMKN